VTAGAVSIEPGCNARRSRKSTTRAERRSTYFGEHNFNVVTNPKVEIRVDDGRHYLLTSKEKFDGIIRSARSLGEGRCGALHQGILRGGQAAPNPGGVVTQFVQLYESNEEAVKSEIATFFEVFPNGAVFANLVNGQGYDVVLVGQAEPMVIDVDKMQQRLNLPSTRLSCNRSAKRNLLRVDLLSTFAGHATDLKTLARGRVINRDRNLRLQYLAGLGLNL